MHTDPLHSAHDATTASNKYYGEPVFEEVYFNTLK